MFINKFYMYILLKTWYLSLRIFSYSYSINISFYKFFRILRACSSSIEELTKLQSFPFTENPAHTFHDFFSKTFVFITSNSETNNRACMHRGANSSNWIQNNRVSISIRAQCVYTQMPSPYLDTRLNKRSSYICDRLPSVFVVIATFIASRVSILATNPIDPSFSSSRVDREIVYRPLSIHLLPSSSLSNNLTIVRSHFGRIPLISSVKPVTGFVKFVTKN